MLKYSEIQVSRNNRINVVIDKLPILTSQITTVDMGTITLGETEPANQFIDYAEPSNKIQYTHLDISFLLDENMDAYTEAFNMMQTAAHDQTVEEFRRAVYTDVTIQIMNSEYTNAVRTFNFHDAWVTSLGPIPFDFSAGDGTQCIVTMPFSKMEIHPHSSNLTGARNPLFVEDRAPYRDESVEF